MLKKVFIISLVLFVILLISWGVYYVSFKMPSKNTQDENENAPEIQEIIEQMNSSIETVLDHPVSSPVLDTDNTSILYFHRDTGELYRYNTQSAEKSLLLENKKTGAPYAYWSGSRNEFLAKSQDKFYLYDIRSENPIPFKDNVVEITWDSLSEKIVYVYRDPKTGIRSINISQPNGKQWEELVSIGNKRVFLSSVPRSPNITYWPIPANTTASSLRLVNILTGQERTLLSEKYGADYLWAPSGKKVLVSFAPNKSSSEMLLAVMNNDGGEFTTLSNTPTITTKCAWSKDSIHVYCAIPTSIPQSTVMPDDYMDKTIFTRDTFWKINTQTSASERIIETSELTESLDASNVFLSGDETSLYFVERRTNMLYRIKM